MNFTQVRLHEGRGEVREEERGGEEREVRE
jgi:hypothetical protein